MALASKNPAIQVKDLTLKFGNEVILDKISLDIAEGESFVIVGPSGHGKSVLLKTFAGLIAPTSGTVSVRGQDWQKLAGVSRQELLCKLGMLFQKNALFDSLKVGENVAFPLQEVTALDSGAINRKVDLFLEAVGIPHAKDLFPDEISGGMQKRLGIARALALDPEIIFYDDPTAGLDPITSRKIIELILDLRRKNNSTIVTITNDMNRAYQLADRIGMVVDRELVVTGSPEDTQKHQDQRVHQFVRGELLGPLTAERSP
jgi:phospholipid/cholesterol/gamma-HCH transport system ATP-binding protein